MWSAELLSRIQFGFNVGFHILWPSLNVGLALFLLVCEVCYLKTKNDEEIAICMRDSGFEFRYQDNWYFAKEGTLEPFKK